MESSFSLDGILSDFMAKPELVSSVLSMAGKLAEGFSAMSAAPSGENAPTSSQKASALLPAPSESSPSHHRGDMHKHKKLVEALMLYVSEEKRPKLEMVLKILEIVELAEGLRG